MKNQKNNYISTSVMIYDGIHEAVHEVYNLIKLVEDRFKYLLYKKCGYKGFDYNVFNIVRGLKVKRYIIMLLLCLTFVVSFNVSLSASGVGDLEIEPLYEPTMTFVNDNLGKFNYDPFLRRLKTDVLENENNFLGVDTIQSYDEVTSGGEQTLISLLGATIYIPSGWSCMGGFGVFNIIADGLYINDYEGINYGPIDYGIGLGYAPDFESGTLNNIQADSIMFNLGSGWFNGPYVPENSIKISNITGGTDVSKVSFINWVISVNGIITGGVYTGGETIEEKTMSLSELYSRNENFTHSNSWGVSSNYVITNELLMANNRGVDSLYLDYSNIVIYDEFIINYSQNNYSLIPTSIIVDVSTVDNIIWEWNYKIQTDVGLTEIRTQTWTLDSQYMRDNKINVLPQNPLYNVSTDQMSNFINLYGQNQFINLSSARVTINFNINVNEFDIIQYSVDKNMYDEANELAWYDFDNMGSVSNLGESLLDGANNFLQLEIFPNFRILDILLIAIAIPMLIWVLKVFFGG